MTPGRRDGATPVPVEVVDVPLIGADGGDGRQSSDEPAPKPDWRRSIGVALVAGAIIGVGVAAFVLGSDDEADGDVARAGVETTIDDDELASLITTPPTLPPLDTLPPVVERAPSGEESPPPAPSGAFDVVTVPSYPQVTGVGLSELVRYDIDEAVDRLGQDRSRRAETRLELGAAGYVLDVVVERDAERDRYRVTLTTAGRTQVVTVDVPGNRATIDGSDGDVIEFTNDELLAGVDSDGVDDFFDRMLLGPLRPDSYEPIATRGRGLVTIDDRVAREFVTRIDGSRIPQWQLYAFGPVFEFRDQDRPNELEYQVYVDEAGDIVQVNGLAAVGNVPQLVTHRIVDPDEPIVIELAQVSTAAPSTAATAPPATTPSTTTPPTTTPPTTTSPPTDG